MKIKSNMQLVVGKASECSYTMLLLDCNVLVWENSVAITLIGIAIVIPLRSCMFLFWFLSSPSSSLLMLLLLLVWWSLISTFDETITSPYCIHVVYLGLVTFTSRWCVRSLVYTVFFFVIRILFISLTSGSTSQCAWSVYTCGFWYDGNTTKTLASTRRSAYRIERRKEASPEQKLRRIKGWLARPEQQMQTILIASP